ncbi:MAG: hypothetical protein P8M28_09250 [Alphaproteobacteria bacterium]|nr:hypothetical protein [Alphaproteobacteria bacterium]
MYRTKCLMAGLVLSVVAGGNVTHAAQPNPSCTDRNAAVTHLAKKYQEQPVAIGLASNGGVFEVLTNDAGSTWSIIVTMSDGTSCMVAAGEHWEPVETNQAGSPT